jgi:hypothetical protein
MTQIIDPNLLMFTSWEPKLKNRFTLDIDGVPTYLIKKCDRPKVTSGEVVIDHINVQRYTKGKTNWEEISIELYDPITPSGMQIALNWLRLSHESITGRDGYANFYKKDITLNIMGPIGDIVENWTIKGAWAKSIDAGDMDWSSEEASTITLSVRYDYAVLNF